MTSVAIRLPIALPARIAHLACRRGGRATDRRDWRPYFRVYRRRRRTSTEVTLDSVQTWDGATARSKRIRSKSTTCKTKTPGFPPGPCFLTPALPVGSLRFGPRELLYCSVSIHGCKPEFRRRLGSSSAGDSSNASGIHESP